MTPEEQKEKYIERITGYVDWCVASKFDPQTIVELVQSKYALADIMDGEL